MNGDHGKAIRAARRDAERREAEQDEMRRRLAHRYGAERAREIMAGRDPEANADLEAWHRVGRR